MERSPIRWTPPPGYLRIDGDDGSLLAVRASRADEIERLGYGPQSDGGVRPSDLSGRRKMFELPLAGGPVVLRRFARGGLVRHVRQGHSDPLRPFRELELALRLRAAGVPTPEVVLARARPRGGQGAAVGGFARRLRGWKLELGTTRVDGSVDLWSAAERALAGRLDYRSRATAAHTAGRLLRRCFEAQLLHVDLNPRNVLLAEAALGGTAVEGPAGGDSANGDSADAAWIIDLDRCRIADGGLSEGQIRTMLLRLLRFVERRERQAGRSLTRSDRLRLLKEAGPREAWRDRWRAIDAAHRRQAPWRALSQGLDRLLTRGTGAVGQAPRPPSD